MLRGMAMAFLLTAFLSCGDDPPNVGATCTVAGGGCDEGLTCNTGFAGGYCTAPCAATGTTMGCPEGAICDSVSGLGTTCVRICKTSTDCRAGVDCNGVSGSNVKACKPK
jgi:hypothetical protein